MKNQERISKINKFMKAVIESLQMNINDFTLNLANGESYEKNIYNWSISLFEQGKSIEDVISHIYQKRMSILLESQTDFKVQKYITANHKKVMHQLQLTPLYYEQSEKQKIVLQHKIDRLVRTNLYSYKSVIAQILKIIQLRNQSDSLFSYRSPPTILKAN